MAKCEQITTLRRDRLVPRAPRGNLAPARMVEIEKAVFPAIGVPVREQEWSRGESNPRPQPGREPENRSREERGRRPAPGLVDDPLDGDRGIDDGRPRPLSATHRVRGRIRTVLSVAWPFRVRRVAARLAAARRAKACRFFKTESDSRPRISSSTDRPCARASRRGRRGYVL